MARRRPVDLPSRTVVAVLGGGLAAAAAVGGVGLLGFEVAGVAEQIHTDGFVLRLAGAAAVLLLLATVTAWLSAREVATEVRSVASGIRTMVSEAGGSELPEHSSQASVVPVRGLDEVGELTLRLEALRRHFVASLERARDARRRAEEADRFRTEFLTTVSHELRTPLNSILGFTDVLKAEIDGPLSPAQHEDVISIGNAGRHLMSLFNDVLDLSAAASGTLELTREPVDVAQVLGATAEELRGHLGGRALEIRLEVGEGVPPADADAKRLRQIVTNLASNALKFTDHGEVVLGARSSEGGVTLFVRDTGPGIAADQVAAMFEEFGQAEGERRRRRGVGLGLAISRQLTEVHGGRIEVDTVLGRGSTFYVHLPAWGAR